ncbi:MAG: PD-(D/E)XK nuclease family protein [Chloroflexota bacterium]|nr:PD-(D/E)XK nuclease family protein [Chloroflexota bacterium]
MTSQPETTGEEGPDPREALEKFVLDSEELARLDELTSQFNIFEALGIVRQEIRHSDFLAWLMNPAQTHGLGDYFLKGFLFKTSVEARMRGKETISPVDVDVWDLTETEIRREWRNIDILLVENAQRFVCVIENKIYSSEHSDQLRRYREVVETEFPDYTRHYVLLNVSGEEPSDSEYYVGVTYDEVCDVIERLLKMRASTIGDDVATALSHYVTMIRRRVMPDMEIQELCRRIYSKHRAALDLIYEHRPDLQAAISDALLEMIRADQEFTLDLSSKRVIRFLPVSWDRPELKVGQGFTKTGRLLLFQFWNNPNWLGLGLMLGPGDENVRRQIYEAARKMGSPFTLGPKGSSTKFVWLFSKEILPTADYDDLDFEKIQARVQEAWSAFKSNELPLMINLIDQAFP